MVGSSRKRREGEPISSHPMFSLFLSPPEIPRTCAHRFHVKRCLKSAAFVSKAYDHEAHTSSTTASCQSLVSFVSALCKLRVSFVSALCQRRVNQLMHAKASRSAHTRCLASSARRRRTPAQKSPMAAFCQEI